MSASDQDIFAFKSEFSAFALLPDAEVAAAFMVADLFVDPDMWTPTDYVQARLLFAAHFLTLEQQNLASMRLSTSTGIGGSLDTFLSEIRFGERTIRAEQRQLLKSSMNDPLMLSMTIWGRIFSALLARNVPAIAIV